MGRYQGMDLDILSPDEITSRYPFAETHDLTGALYDPNDGDIDPAQLTQALAKGARDLGAKIYRFCPATGARRENDEWVISTEKGEIRCEYVVNAAGYYAREVGKMFGRDVPMMVMSHQYMLFDEVPEVAAWTAEAGHKLPLLRDVDSSYYLRQEKNGFNLGPYERNCKAHWVTPDDPMPEDFSFQLYPDDLERLEWYINDACERVPLLGTAGLTKNINGPIPYTPDGNPLIGPMPGVPNAFEACVFTFGICQGGGAGKVLAEWVMEGETEWDMWSCDPRRFTAFCDQDYTIAKGMEVYGHEYGMHFPHHAWPAGRNKKLSPVHDRVAALGAQFGAYNGWERANWYARPGDDTSEEATQTWAREGSWFGAVREECQAVRDAAGILDLPGFSRFRVQGPGARDWLNSMITGMAPKPGRIGLGYFADGKGRIVTEMSLMALDEDFFFLITAATAQLHDYEWLVKHLPAGSEIAVEDVTEAFSCQILTGPKSREILSGITDADLSKAWLTHQSAQVDGTWCQLVRVSFAGELGWEIHSKTEDTPKIFDAVMKAGEPHGLKPFGMFALNSLRLEKGYRAWKGDLSTDYTVLQGGLDRFVKWDKPDFLGSPRGHHRRRRLGCSVAYHLAKLGWTDIVLLERKQLTCGTTWHAAGLIGQLRATQNMTRLAKYSADLYVKLEEETGVATGMRQVGSITVALTEDRRRNSCARPRWPAPSTSRSSEIGPPRSRRCIRISRSATSPAPCTCPATGNATRPTSPWRWPRARGCGARIIEGVKVTAGHR
jgi:dimethylglycine dehydrogenase